MCRLAAFNQRRAGDENGLGHGLLTSEEVEEVHCGSANRSVEEPRVAAPTSLGVGLKRDTVGVAAFRNRQKQKR